MNDVAKLIICLKSYGFAEKEIRIVYEAGTLNNLDSLTYQYQDANDFFLKNKDQIISRIKKQIPFYEINVNFDFLELNEMIENPIFIEKENETLPALFKTMKTSEEEASLDSILKERLKNNGLYLLYLCDRYVQTDIEYESIFQNCDRRIYAKIKANFLKEEDIDYVFNFLKTKNRFYAIIRFLINRGTTEETIEEFKKRIPLKERSEQKDYMRTLKEKKYWYMED